MYLSLYCQGLKRLLEVCVWEGAEDRTETAIFWPPLLWPSTLCLSRSPDAQPEAQRPSSQLDDGFLYCILSATSLDPNSSGPQGSFGLVWLSLPHLVYNSVRSLTGTVWLLSWLSYIIVQRLLSRLLDLWNRMLDRRQAEITVMQFRGPHFISQFPPTRFPLITAIRMCHFLPVHHLGMTFLAGSKVKIKQKKRYSTLPISTEPESHHICSLVFYPGHFVYLPQTRTWLREINRYYTVFLHQAPERVYECICEDRVKNYFSLSSVHRWIYFDIFLNKCILQNTCDDPYIATTLSVSLKMVKI